MKKALLTTLGAGLSAVILLVIALPAYGGTSESYSVRGFVELLIERGIVPGDMASKARAVASVLSASDEVVPEKVTPYHEHVSVSVSQLIEYASHTYKAGADVKGLLVLATNTHTEDIYPGAVRGCQVVYRIYDKETLLYDSTTQKACTTDEHVTYRLAPDQTRMFEVTHPPSRYALSPGTYTFVLEYPGYGSGKIDITIE